MSRQFNCSQDTITSFIEKSSWLWGPLEHHTFCLSQEDDEMEDLWGDKELPHIGDEHTTSIFPCHSWSYPLLFHFSPFIPHWPLNKWQEQLWAEQNQQTLPPWQLALCDQPANGLWLWCDQTAACVANKPTNTIARLALALASVTVPLG